MTARELLQFLFDNPVDETARTVEGWIRQSKRFRAFVYYNRTKIRKKLCAAATPEARRSAEMELQVARRFVEDHRCQVEYERY